MSDHEVAVMHLDIHETVFLEAGSGMKEITDLELKPDVQVLQESDHVMIRGSLVLRGQYEQRSSEVQEDGELSLQFSEYDLGESETTEREEPNRTPIFYQIPIEISVASYRVPDAEHVRIDVEDLDFDMNEHGELKLLARLIIFGIYQGLPAEKSSSPEITSVLGDVPPIQEMAYQEQKSAEDRKTDGIENKDNQEEENAGQDPGLEELTEKEKEVLRDIQVLEKAFPADEEQRRPEATQAEAVQAEATQAEAAQAEENQAESAQSGATQAKEAQAEATQAKEAQAEADQRMHVSNVIPLHPQPGEGADLAQEEATHSEQKGEEPIRQEVAKAEVTAEGEWAEPGVAEDVREDYQGEQEKKVFHVSVSAKRHQEKTTEGKKQSIADWLIKSAGEASLDENRGTEMEDSELADHAASEEIRTVDQEVLNGTEEQVITNETVSSWVDDYLSPLLRDREETFSSIRVHKVKPEEDVTFLAEQYGIDVQKLLSTNHYSHFSELKEGDVLLIPK